MDWCFRTWQTTTCWGLAFQPAKAVHAHHPTRSVALSLPLRFPRSCAPQPPLLNRPGMGARLITYYRKKDGADTGHLELKKGARRSLHGVKLHRAGCVVLQVVDFARRMARTRGTWS